jgi:RNA polymerase sigma factor (sigma-70 family)
VETAWPWCKTSGNPLGQEKYVGRGVKKPPPPAAQARDELDAKLLRQLADARTPGREDPLRARNIEAQLLGGYWGWTKGIVRGKLRGVNDPDHDAEEITQDVLRRLHVALLKRQAFGKPFFKVVLDNIGWALMDHWKAPARQDESDPADLDALPPQSRAPELLPSLAEQARDVDARLEGLSERDRRIVTERLYVGRTPEEVAELLGVSREACDTAFSRAVARLRETPQMADVRKRGNLSARKEE